MVVQIGVQVRPKHPHKTWNNKHIVGQNLKTGKSNKSNQCQDASFFYDLISERIFFLGLMLQHPLV